MARVIERTPNSGWRTVEMASGELVRANGLAAVKRLKSLDVKDLHINYLINKQSPSEAIVEPVEETVELIENPNQQAEDDFLSDLTESVTIVDGDDEEYEDEDEEEDDSEYYYDDDDMFIDDYEEEDVRTKYAEGFAALDAVANQYDNKNVIKSDDDDEELTDLF